MLQPRILWTPAAARHDSGQEAVELAAYAGLHLDPAQQLVLHHGCAERDDGSWASFEVAVVEARQNGKGAILEARELAGLYLFGERRIVHTAHRFDTAVEHFQRLLQLIESQPDLEAKVLKVVRSHGEEGIRLRTGQELRIRTRSGGGARGFGGDLVVADEDMYFSSAQVNALMPILSTRPNPQLWYFGSAVNAAEHEHGATKTRVRNRALAGGDQRLTYLEWSPDATSPDDVDASDPHVWAQANPALGRRISHEYVAAEQRSMTKRGFAVERLSIGDWPDLDAEASPGVHDVTKWTALATPGAVPTDPVALAIDTNPIRTWSTITAAAWSPTRRLLVQVVERRAGTDWVVDRAVELVSRWDPCALVVDEKGPAGSLVKPLQAAGLDPAVTTFGDVVDASSAWYDAIEAAVTDGGAQPDGALAHLGDPLLDDAVRAAQLRGGDRVLYARGKGGKGGEDISPMVSALLAAWGLRRFGDPPPAAGLPGADLLGDQAPNGDPVGAHDLATIGF